MRPYENLSKFYKNDWGKESLRYVDLVFNVMENFNIKAETILDVACGTGILANGLKDEGFKVSGFDLSEEMIDVAKVATSEVDFHIGDMRDFKLDKKFDIITCAFDSINYVLEEEGIKQTLKSIHSHLNENGVFIFDINTPILYEEKHFGVIDREFDGIEFKQILEYDKVTMLGTTIFDFGEGNCETHIQRAYRVSDMDRLIIESGFEILGKYRSFSLLEVNDRTYKVFYVIK